MIRTACAAAAAIAVLCLAAGALARPHAFARVMCAGTYCAIVPAAAPAPLRPRQHHRARRHRLSRAHIGHHHRARTVRGPAPRKAAEMDAGASDRDGRVRPGRAAPARAAAGDRVYGPGSDTPTGGRLIGSGGAVDNARRFVGRNPTGWRTAWCGRFLAMVLPGAAARLHNPAWARDWERLPHVSARVGAVAVLHRGRGGHVGLVSGFDAQGDPILIAGNAGGGRVREYPVAAKSVAVYVSPD
jgi:uncharacterized protein (TIGR02594 family)